MSSSMSSGVLLGSNVSTISPITMATHGYSTPARIAPITPKITKTFSLGLMKLKSFLRGTV